MQWIEDEVRRAKLRMLGKHVIEFTDFSHSRHEDEERSRVLRPHGATEAHGL